MRRIEYAWVVVVCRGPGCGPLSLLRALIAGGACLLLLIWTPSAAAAPAPVTLLSVDGAIGPASADYLARGIARAAHDGHQLVVIELDTPGGLDTSMRMVVKAILASPLPVAVYVAPPGARAASAGTFILMASHVAAMAPGTNLGAATPVQLGGPAGDGAAKPEAQSGAPMGRKLVNDAAASIRALAELRGRNADWAERSVRDALSLPASEALKAGAIDYLAADVPALLAQVDGRRIRLDRPDAGPPTLHTRGAPLYLAHPDGRTRLLEILSDPSLALILMSIGIYGLLFEFMSPGAVAPGVVGALCLLLGLYGLHLLPLNYAGLGLILLGLAFMVGEAFLPSFGALGLGGTAAFVAGALILIDTDVPGYGVPAALVVPLAIASALLVAGMGAVALRTRRRAVVGGPNELVGSRAEVIGTGASDAWANVNGETWRVASAVALRPGQAVQVVARKGARLEVVPVTQVCVNDHGCASHAPLSHVNTGE